MTGKHTAFLVETRDHSGTFGDGRKLIKPVGGYTIVSVLYCLQLTGRAMNTAVHFVVIVPTHSRVNLCEVGPTIVTDGHCRFAAFRSRRFRMLP